jgi:plastocyanin
MRRAGVVAVVIGVVMIVFSTGPVAIGDPPTPSAGTTGPTGPSGPSGPTAPAGPAKPSEPAAPAKPVADERPPARGETGPRGDSTRGTPDAREQTAEPAPRRQARSERRQATTREATASAPRATAAADTTVDMVNGDRFNPRTVSINTGDTITWDNVDTIPHNAIAVDGAFSSPQLVQPGSTFRHTFNTAGSFAYACTIHPGMTGTVNVAGSGGGSGGGGSGGGSGGSSDATGTIAGDDGTTVQPPPPSSDSLDDISSGGSTADDTTSGDDTFSDDTTSGSSGSLADTGYEAGEVGLSGTAMLLLGLGLLAGDRRRARRRAARHL